MADEEVQTPAPVEEAQAEPASEPTPEPAQEEEAKASTSGRLKAVKKAPAPQVAPGNLVHYVYNGKHVPGTIEQVLEDGAVQVRAQDNSLLASSVSFDADGAESTWHLPEE